jgi:hypothetical protein
MPAKHEGPMQGLKGPRRRAPRALACSRALSVLAMLAMCLFSALARAAEPWRIPVVFHVAERDGQAVAPASFIAEQLAAANSIYGPLGIELVDSEQTSLPPGHAELITRADRDALAPHVRKGAIHCFVVATLMDVDEPGRERRGVHWRPRQTPSPSFVIVSKISKPYVLAHELGHFFGNREHSKVPGNLMSYTRTERPPFLDELQVRRVLRTLTAMLKLGTLVPSVNERPATP